jgi:hypothetical protein
MFGYEYFIRILPERELRRSLLDDEAEDATTKRPRGR